VSTAVINSKKKSIERDNVQSKLDLATALSFLASASYEKAAISFLKIGPPKDLGDWIGKVGFSCMIGHQICTHSTLFLLPFSLWHLEI